MTGSGNLIAATRNGIDLSARRSLVRVSLSLATAARSPACTSGILRLRLALQQREMAEALGGFRVMFCTVESALTTPVMTRNIVIRPANGSATVFHTNTAAGPLSTP